jgi:hypothetical protein
MAPETDKLPPTLYDWPPEKEHVPLKKHDGTHPAILACWSLLAFLIFFYIRHLCSLH